MGDKDLFSDFIPIYFLPHLYRRKWVADIKLRIKYAATFTYVHFGITTYVMISTFKASSARIRADLHLWELFRIRSVVASSHCRDTRETSCITVTSIFHIHEKKKNCNDKIIFL